MQKLARSVLYLPTIFSKRSPLLHFTATTTATSSTHSSPVDGAAILSDHDLANLRRLLVSLCDAGHHLEAVRLLDAALLAAPPLSSLPLTDFVDRLCSLPDMTASMALLTAIRLHRRRPSPLPFCSMFLSSYFRLCRLREAAKIFAWLCSADSPCRPDMEVYRTALQGFCATGRASEAVRVLREMARDGLVPSVELRVSVCQVLLREARVQEALDLDSALKKAAEADDGHSDGIDVITELLDRMIKDWEE